MSSSYNFIDHTADIAVEVTADSTGELFAASALALRETVVEFEFAGTKNEFHLKLDSHSLESLLVNFLNELNFRLISKGKIFNKISSIKIYQADENWNLDCTLSENEVDEEKIKTEIKSVTYHQMEIKKVNGKYSTRIVFDI